ncbi:DNA-3-methyladenine glycosylase [Paenibacillus marinisediminis]
MMHHDRDIAMPVDVEAALPGQRLPRSWYRQGALRLGPQLLGRTLARRVEGGIIRTMIVETESYVALHDKGSHAYGNRRTKRTETMFLDGGVAYVYLIYGMYHCLNVVAASTDQAEAVLIRGVAPLSAEDERLMQQLRPLKSRKAAELSNGPGKLCRALAIGKELDGADLVNGEDIWLEAGTLVEPSRIVCAPRIGIPYAEEYADKLWRFYIEGHPYVSVAYQEAVPLSIAERMEEDEYMHLTAKDESE